MTSPAEVRTIFTLIHVPTDSMFAEHAPINEIIPKNWGIVKLVRLSNTPIYGIVRFLTYLIINLARFPSHTFVPHCLDNETFHTKLLEK